MPTIQFQRPDGRELNGYLAEPAREAAPGVVVIQEWWGLNDQIRGVADRLAKSGYRALVPDLYRGRSTVEAQEAEHLMGGLDFGDAAGQDIRGAVLFLKEKKAAAAIMGFCMGGALTLLAAGAVPEADAAVCWYGFPPLDYIDASRIRMPLLGHFAKDDAFFPIATVDALEKKLENGGISFEFHRYDAKHAFANETLIDPPIPAGYDPAAAEAAWARTMSFLGRHMAGS